MGVTIPDALVRGVLGQPHARGLLELLVDAKGPLAYAEARTALGLHPEAFQRALARLETFSLVQMRAPDAAPPGKRRYRVLLEASNRGRKLIRVWRTLNAEYAKAFVGETPPRPKATRTPRKKA